MKSKKNTSPSNIRAAKNSAKRSAGKDVPKITKHKKNTVKLSERFALNFTVKKVDTRALTAGLTTGPNLALMRLQALEKRDQTSSWTLAMAPVDTALANWTPMGPLAIPNGQTYGGARILISGRVTAISPHPVKAGTIFIGTSRGGVWRTTDGGDTWTALGDNQPSLAIGALAIGNNNPDVLYAGTGEGNVQYYSTAYELSSAPGVYLGVGVLRSIDGGNTWTHHAAALLANRSFYRISVDRNNSDRAFAATSLGLCRTTDGINWTQLSGGGLPVIDESVIACTDVIIDSNDNTGNTVYAAFWKNGIYKTTNALASNPTFNLLTTGLPAGNTTSRISLTQSASSPEQKFALIASSGDAFLGLYRTTNSSGTDWELCTDSSTVELYGAFTSDVNVDPTTPDLVYVSGVELYKCQRNSSSGAWSVTNVGSNIHPDSHCFAFHPTLNQTIYSGNDGGFYISRNAGTTWEDAPNEGLCLLQYEAIDNHGSSDAIVQCGTQDNGTQQYRNSPVHYHSADGDGGYCTISKINGNHMTHSYYGNNIERSTSGGKFGTYANIAGGLNGNGLFYPPAAISHVSERMAWGTDRINIDDAMGTGGWPGNGITLSGINGRVSALFFASDTIIYCATTSGQVYRLDQSGTTWNTRALHSSSLPLNEWIWDVQCLPGDVNTIIIVFSGFGIPNHVWRGIVPVSGVATWTALSVGLPDVPMYALAFGSNTQWFVGTDIGVFRTIDAGVTWSNFSQGLPNTAIYDLRIRDGSNLLRAATHGRGLWELRTDLVSQPTVDIFVRDHIMDTGRPPTNVPVAAAWEDITRHIALNDTCYWWDCADIKTDAPPIWQLQPNEANYLNFETKLIHEHPEKGNQNQVYVQVHNRGPLTARNVTVRIMTAGASAGLPDLPGNFWSTWPNCTGDANWTPVGLPQTIASLEPLRPTVLKWNWTPGANADTHSCMLVVIDSKSDPIPAKIKTTFNIAQLVTKDKHIGLKNLHLVNLLRNSTITLPFYLHGSRGIQNKYLLQIPVLQYPEIQMSFLMSQALSRQVGTIMPKNLKAAKLGIKDLQLIKEFWLKHEMRTDQSWEGFLKTYDTTRIFSVAADSKLAELPVTISNDTRETIVLVFRTGKLTRTKPGDLAKLTIVQTDSAGNLAGGSTFVLRMAYLT